MENKTNITQRNIVLVNPVMRKNISVLRVERCQQKRKHSVGLWPPITLLEIALYLRQLQNINIEIIDGEAEQISFVDLVTMVKQKQPDMVVIATTLPTMDDDSSFARQLKEELDSVTTVSIGLPATVCPEEILKGDGIDFAVRGEPELTIVELAKSLYQKGSSLNTIQGLAVKENGATVITETRRSRDSYNYPAMPDRGLIKNSQYVLPLTGEMFTVIKVSRGCDYSCAFCTSNAYYGKGWRGRSIENIIKEIKDCIENYGIKTFLFLADTFNARKDFVRTLCEEIIREKLKITWVANSRIDLLDEDLIRLMHESGCRLISLGVETYNDALLKTAEKKQDVARINLSINLLHEYKIYSYGYFLFGLRGETIRTMIQTVTEAWRSSLDFACFYSVTAYPGTEYYNDFNRVQNKDYFHGISTHVCYKTLPSWIITVFRLCATVLFYVKPFRLRHLATYLFKRKLC